MSCWGGTGSRHFLSSLTAGTPGWLPVRSRCVLYSIFKFFVNSESASCSSSLPTHDPEADGCTDEPCHYRQLKRLGERFQAVQLCFRNLRQLVNLIRDVSQNLFWFSTCNRFKILFAALESGHVPKEE